MSVAKASIDINAPVKRVYEVISDFEAYPEFLTETKDVVIEKATDKSALVVFTISVIKKITYKLDIKMTPPKGISWKLVNGDMMKKNNGRWKLTEQDGVTKAEYEIDMDFGGMVPKAISSKLIGSNLPAMMKAFRDRVEDMAS